MVRGNNNRISKSKNTFIIIIFIMLRSIIAIFQFIFGLLFKLLGKVLLIIIAYVFILSIIWIFRVEIMRIVI